MAKKPTIVIGADHAALDMKKALKKYLEDNGYKVKDAGPKTRKSVNYPDFAKKVARAVLDREFDLGILICGTGIGMSMTANRFKGIRCALVHDTYTAKMAKAHNNANVLAIGARVTGLGVAEEILDTWLQTKFEGKRHKKRIDLIDKD
jgi:ribose 5-phosphate isomerase B